MPEVGDRRQVGHHVLRVVPSSTGSSHIRLASPSIRRAASASSALSLAGDTAYRFSADADLGLRESASRSARTAKPWASSRWCAARTAAADSRRPGACTPEP